MFRTPRSLLAAALCTAALAACSDAPTGLRDGSDDPEVIAANRNLGGSVILTASKKDVIGRAPGATQSLQPYAPKLCARTIEGEQEPGCTYPTYPTITPTLLPPPLFTVYADISTSLSYGTKYVTLTGWGDYQYASYGELSVSFRNAGGCYTTPTEYTSAYQFSYNAPFTLSSSRNASYNGTISSVNWAVHASGYAESPEGGTRTYSANKVLCF